MELISLGKYGAYPKGNCGTSSYLVKTDKTVVFDMGSGTLSKLLSVEKVENIDCIFLTHFHSDHTIDLLVLRYHKYFKEGNKIDLYMPYEESTECEYLSNIEKFNIHYVKLGENIQIGETIVTPCVASHVGVSFGYTIKYGGKVLYYTGDTELTDEVINISKSADLTILDTFCDYSYFTQDMKHCNTLDFANISKNTKGKVLATHIMADREEKIIEEIGEDKVIQELVTYKI